MAKHLRLALRRLMVFAKAMHQGVRKRASKTLACRPCSSKNGQTAWNKGIKGSAGLHPDSCTTQFRKGRAPEESRNYLPIGSQRLTKNGWLEEKGYR